MPTERIFFRCKTLHLGCVSVALCEKKKFSSTNATQFLKSTSWFKVFSDFKLK